MLESADVTLVNAGKFCDLSSGYLRIAAIWGFVNRHYAASPMDKTGGKPGTSSRNLTSRTARRNCVDRDSRRVTTVTLHTA